MAKVTWSSYGPDDPIFSQGPQSFVPVSRPSTESSQTGTDGEPQTKAPDSAPLDPNETYSPDHPRYAEACKANPMLPLQNGLEEALNRGLEKANPGFRVDRRTGNLVPIPSQQSESTSPPSNAAR
jgi:hypothetical protein